MTSTSRPMALLLGLTLTGLTLAACSSGETTDAAPAAASDGSPAAADGSPAAADSSGGACAPEDVVFVGQVRDESNPYEAAWLDAGDAYAESQGLSQQRLLYAGDSATQQEQIRQVLAGGDASCTVMNILPGGDSDTRPIVEAAQGAGAYVVTQWNKPADLQPTDYDHWVSHITYDGVESGTLIAEAMFEEMGGSGGIIALQGILDTGAAKDRFAGLEAALAENPDITLLDEQTANFGRDEALSVTQTLLTKHGEDVKGIWAANDDMALGALQALEQAGRTDVAVVGIDAVPEAVQGVVDGTMTATVSSDGPWQGGIGLAMGYCVATGELAVADIPDDDRAFFARQTLITADNAEENLTPTVDPAEFECASLFDRVEAPLP